LFTGLIEDIGIIKSIVKGETSASITVKAQNILNDLKIGDSISTNGVCLTVTSFSSDAFDMEVMPETIRRSNLRNLKKGDNVNLERAVKVGDRLGGHIVSGHIDGIGYIEEIKEEDNAVWIKVKASSEVLRYIIYKGSVAIDGISLTVAYIDNEAFKVSIIPHTKNTTTLLHKKIGDNVNIECDSIGKYVEKILFSKVERLEDKSINMDFLRENGFV
jgi:riboflavin synthase